MALAKRPGANNQGQPERDKPEKEEKALEFISKVGQSAAKPAQNKEQEQEENITRRGIMVYIDTDMLKKVDKARKKRGLTRSAWFNYCASKMLENDDS